MACGRTCARVRSTGHRGAKAASFVGAGSVCSPEKGSEVHDRTIPRRVAEAVVGPECPDQLRLKIMPPWRPRWRINDADRPLGPGMNQSYQPECYRGDECGRRDRDDPGPYDAARHAPSHCRQPMGSAHADNGSGDGVRSAYGDSC